ncbi:hypothetical protein C8Q77DRAFT_1156679 [Trametes polyzona]|nr:hypothetical protein C8Q77DRAFT_1156679 [Trametes polyzona]
MAYSHYTVSQGYAEVERQEPWQFLYQQEAPLPVVPAPTAAQDRTLDGEDIFLGPRGKAITCEWGLCGHKTTVGGLLDHIFRSNWPSHQDMVRLEKDVHSKEGARSKKELVQCQWTGCKAKVQYSGLPRHIQDQHSREKRIMCSRCGHDGREEYYRNHHGPARFCQAQPKKNPRFPEIFNAHQAPSSVGPVRRARTLDRSRASAQAHAAYPSVRPRVQGHTSSSNVAARSHPTQPAQPVAGPSRLPDVVPPQPQAAWADAWSSDNLAPMGNHFQLPQLERAGPSALGGLAFDATRYQAYLDNASHPMALPPSLNPPAMNLPKYDLPQFGGRTGDDDAWLFDENVAPPQAPIPDYFVARPAIVPPSVHPAMASVCQNAAEEPDFGVLPSAENTEPLPSSNFPEMNIFNEDRLSADAHGIIGHCDFVFDLDMDFFFKTGQVKSRGKQDA